jgi:cell division initiation protein
VKLTPLDIHHKEFRHSLRGYSEEEVDQFLDEVADEFERLFKENIDLSEKLDAANDKLRGYSDMERTLHNTMLAAQQSAEDIVNKARKEAELVLRDAEIKAKELVHAALAEKQKAQGEFGRIKQAEEDFRGRFRALLEEHMRNVAEIPVSAEAAALAAEPIEEYRPEVPQVVVPEQFAAPAPQAVPAPSEALVAEPAPEEPPASGFVTSVHLGESAAPQPSAETAAFVEPVEFTFTGAGERDEDIDIEEID